MSTVKMWELEEAAEEYRLARIKRDTLIKLAVQQGVPRQEVARFVGLSRPRIDQIARGE